MRYTRAMCERLNVIDGLLSRWVSDEFGISFATQTNKDLRPTQPVDTIAVTQPGPGQLTTTWGITPSWAKNLVINARIETLSEQPAFTQALSTHRCIVPCSGWYEWRAEGLKEQCYSFTHADGFPVLIAGMWFEQPTGASLITLTTNALGRCGEIHSRMPLLIEPDDADLWLNGQATEITPMLAAQRKNYITVRRV